MVCVCSSVCVCGIHGWRRMCKGGDGRQTGGVLLKTKTQRQDEPEEAAAAAAVTSTVAASQVDSSPAGKWKEALPSRLGLVSLPLSPPSLHAYQVRGVDGATRGGGISLARGRGAGLIICEKQQASRWTAMGEDSPRWRGPRRKYSAHLQFVAAST